jgi:hypothetical protein
MIAIPAAETLTGEEMAADQFEALGMRSLDVLAVAMRTFHDEYPFE